MQKALDIILNKDIKKIIIDTITGIYPSPKNGFINIKAIKNISKRKRITFNKFIYNVVLQIKTKKTIRSLQLFFEVKSYSPHLLKQILLPLSRTKKYHPLIHQITPSKENINTFFPIVKKE